MPGGEMVTTPAYYGSRSKDSAVAVIGHLLHLVQALFLKLNITYCQHLIYGQDIQNPGGQLPKRQALHIHARRIALHRRIYKLFQP